MAIEIHYDVIVIGGGPAGLSAALWCADLGLKATVVESKSEFGGQLLHIYDPIRNYPGISAISGVELRDRLVSQAGDQPIDLRTGAAILTVDLAARLICMADGTVVNSKAMILATGVRRRKLGVAGEEEFNGKGILDSGVRNRGNVRGKRVVIVGGGDAAVENAIILGKEADAVTVVHRGDRLRARAEFVERAEAMENVNLVTGHVVSAISGDDRVRSVEVRSAAASVITRIPADAVLIRIGVEPNTEPFAGQVDLDENGYIRTDAVCRTSVENVFAAGDVANEISPTIVTAAGMGSAAAKAAYAAISSER